MKISETTLEAIKDYCGVYDGESDSILTACMAAAKSYIMSYTGLDEGGIELHDDITIAYMIIVNDLFSRRDYSLNMTYSAVNPAVKTILGMHSVNNIG